MFAVTFPGQGSQKQGMGRALCGSFSEASSVFDRVSEGTGKDLREICFHLPEDELRQTQNAQLALFTTGVAAYECLKSGIAGMNPTCYAGHSVGEYAALVAAGYLTVESGAKLVQLRGDLMASSGGTRPGTMVAVLGMSADDLDQVCKDSSSEGDEVVIANDNCPGQLVISGDLNAVQRAAALASERGAKRTLPLSVSGAFHSPLMETSAIALREGLDAATFTRPHGGPVVANVDAASITDPASWPDALSRQLCGRVRWAESICAMRDQGVKLFVECGSGEVLTGLLKRIDRDLAGVPVVDPVSLSHACETISNHEVYA